MRLYEISCAEKHTGLPAGRIHHPEIAGFDLNTGMG
jgi:hypothetical protein